nr:integrase, catalytic region, zinc finger, CCHC-type, peptidase aspartic, catalytic [Tanacetum cinerariifolium]
MRPFGCLVTILNTLDSLDKFDGKVDEGFLVGYSVSSKAFRVFNSGTLTVGNQSNPSAGVQEHFDAKKAGEEIEQQYVLFSVWSSSSINPQNTNRDVAFDEKELEFDEKKPESKVNVSPSSSAQSKKHNDKTKKEAKGKNSGYSKHMTGDRSQIINFVQKFLGTVKFGNDHVAKIMGYGDYQIGNVTISQVYYVEGLGHNLFSVGQFCDSDLEVAFHQHTCFIHNLKRS